MKTISNRIIRKLNPCYDPAEVVKDENEELPVKEWVAKYRDLVRYKTDIIWLLCNKLYMSEKDMRLFAVWCAREALKLIDNPDPRSITACNVAERYANGKATIEELNDARSDAWDVAEDADRTIAASATWAAARSDRTASAATWSATSASATRSAIWAASDSAWSVAWDAQIDQLMTYF